MRLFYVAAGLAILGSSPALAAETHVFDNCCSRSCSGTWNTTASGNVGCSTGDAGPLVCPAAMVPGLNADLKAVEAASGVGATFGKTGLTKAVRAVPADVKIKKR